MLRQEFEKLKFSKNIIAQIYSLICLIKCYLFNYVIPQSTNLWKKSLLSKKIPQICGMKYKSLHRKCGVPKFIINIYPPLTVTVVVTVEYYSNYPKVRVVEN